MGKFNYRIGLLVLVISLAVFFMGSYFIDSYKVNHLLKKDLKEIEGVSSVEIERRSGVDRLNLTLNSTPDLKQIFSKVKERTDKSLISGRYNLNFNLPPNFPDQLVREVDLALHEACQTGEFVKLGSRIEDYKLKYNLEKAVIKIDSSYIYLSLIKDDKALYKVINRRRKG